MDDVLAFSCDPMSIIEDIQKDYMLKDIGKPEYYLGGDYYITKDIGNLQEVEHDVPDQYLSSKWLNIGVKMTYAAPTYID